jgi:hypothetical protein
MKLAKEAVMHVDRGVEVGLRLIGTRPATEQLATSSEDADGAFSRKPFALGSASRTILTRSMSIRLTRDDPDGIRFFFRQLVDFAFELIDLFAIQSLRFASPLWLDHPQAFKHEHAARVLLAHIDNGPRRLVRAVLILVAHMGPQLPIAALSLDRLARLPLLLRDPTQMLIPVLIQALRNRGSHGWATRSGSLQPHFFLARWKQERRMPSCI